MTNERLYEAVALGAKFQIQYIDYDENTWTVPLVCTHDRLLQAKKDHSVRHIKIIYPDGATIIT